MNFYFDLMSLLLNFGAVLLAKLAVWGCIWLIFMFPISALTWLGVAAINKFTYCFLCVDKAISCVSIICAILTAPILFLSLSEIEQELNRVDQSLWYGAE